MLIFHLVLVIIETLILYFLTLSIFNDTSSFTGHSMGLYNAGNMFYMGVVMLVNTRFILQARV